MITTSSYAKRILLVEDLDQFYGPITRWLREEGYDVTLAKTHEEALQALDTMHYHLAIVDIRLDDADDKNEAGMELLLDIEERQLNDVMPCIVLTAYENVSNILVATQQRRVARYIQKRGGYRIELLKAIRELFEERIKINFDLVYDGDSDDLINDVASDINWSMGAKPQLDILTPQVRDLFGKLFAKARRLYMSKLKPGLTGAAVVRVQPTWEHGLGPSYVAKIGRRDKVTTEHQNYEEYVKPYLPPNTIAQVAVAHTQYISALLYTFAETDLGPLEEFDEFYQRSQPELIAASLRNLFQNTCRYWYDSRQRIFEDLPRLYYRAFQLDEKKLVGRIQTVLPQFDPAQETFQFNRIPLVVTNPIAWLARYHNECVLPVYHSITHGDLTGRNIMVDQANKCWLIDFYRTYDSHILRDFVILETDIKYRLLPEPDLEDFIRLEEALLETHQNESLPALDSDLSADIRKAVMVIAHLRSIAHNFSRGLSTRDRDSYKEYLISILMATLNVARLRHIEEDRKLQAMLSASLICNELDKLAGRESPQISADKVVRPLVSSRPAASEKNSAPDTTAQQRFLLEHFSANKLILFVGSDTPGGDWPSPDKLAQQLMAEIDYKPTPDDSPAKLFAIYYNKRRSRPHLINKHVEYYERNRPPAFFKDVTAFRWPAIYTTNQHTYLEEAYQSRQVPYQVISLLEQPEPTQTESVPVYKLYGSLSKAYRNEPPTVLPITEFDHRNRGTLARLKHFLGKLKQDLSQGNFLLMLHACDDELKLIHDYCRPSVRLGTVWVVGANFSEKQQDTYRDLNLRVLPDDPVRLLSVFATVAPHS